MKTTINNNRATVMATLFFTVISFGTSALSQPNQNAYRNDDLSDSFERLEALMNSVEQSLKYAAPSSEYADIQTAWDRLELLANKTDIEIRYKVPDLEQTPAIEYAVQENNRKNETRNDMAFKTGYSRNKSGDNKTEFPKPLETTRP